MLCDICHKNLATVHLTEIINDEVVEMHICRECSKSKKKELIDNVDVFGFFKKEHKEKKVELLKCDFCGISYQEFKKNGLLGCGKCYDVFRRQLLPLLKKIHSFLWHVGKSHLSTDKKIVSKISIEKLREQLSRAINLEEYEEAAKLRDKISAFEKMSNG